MTLRESASERYGKATALRCLHLIKHHNLLVIDECTLDWCIAQYNVAWTLLRDKYVCADFPLFHAIKESMAGVQWLMAHKLDELSLHDKEISKRLYCILMALDLGANTNVQSYLNLHSLDEPFAQLLPKSVSDSGLEQDLDISTEIAQTDEDKIDYVSGLKAYVNIFLAWRHAKQNRIHQTPDETLRLGIDHIQHVIDDLPPELRWRGTLSRDLRTTFGHEVQMVNILVSSLYVKSNFLQHFASSSLRHPTHQIIVKCGMNGRVQSKEPRTSIVDKMLT
ncbi:hypothetical protein TruAng_008749 [Truncatella angustata]|nr:hypothetical protein TruAng_008749 [Truncatella angustata]